MTPIDVISALRDSIYSLEKIEDMWGISDMHNLVSQVLDDLRLARALDCKVAKLTAGEFAEPVLATPEEIRESMARYRAIVEAGRS